MVFACSASLTHLCQGIQALSYTSAVIGPAIESHIPSEEEQNGPRTLRRPCQRGRHNASRGHKGWNDEVLASQPTGISLTAQLHCE